MKLKIPVGVGVLAITMFVYVISLAVWIATLKTGERSVSLVADQHRAEVARGTRNRISDYLAAAEKLTYTNALMFENGVYIHPDRADPRGTETDAFLTAFRSQLYGSRFITTVSMTDRRGNLFGVYTNFDFTFSGMWEQYANATTNEPTLLDYETQREGHPQEGQKVRLIGVTAPYNCSEEVWYTVTNTSIRNDNAWTPMYFMGNVGQVTTMLSQSHVAYRPDGSLIGVTTIDMATGFVGATLADVGHKEMLTFCVDATENALLGTSRNDPILTCTTGESLATCAIANQKFVVPAQSTNADVRDASETVLSKFGGQWAQVNAAQFESDGSLISTEVIVKNRLRWVVVVVVPKDSILGETRDNTTLMIVLQTLCAIVQIILSGMFAYAIRRPLSRLIDHMEDLKRFETTSTEVSPGDSIFSEVSRLQRGHESLRQGMDKVKSFVPPSVLAELSGEADEEDDLESEGSAISGTNTKVTGTADGRSSAGKQSDRQSQSSRSSRQSRSSIQSIMLAPVVINQGIMQKRVSVLALNVRGFHAKFTGKHGNEISRSVSELVSTVIGAAKSHRGMLDFFQGDHFVFTFNAVSANAAHAKQAMLTAMEVTDSCKGLRPYAMQVDCGVGVGVCATGNMGSAEVKRFGVIGNAYSQASKLAQLCRKYADVPVLTVREAAIDVEGALQMQLVDAAALPGRTMIYVPRLVTKQTGDEWLYDQTANPYKTHNEEFEKFLLGEDSDNNNNATDDAPKAEVPMTPEERLEFLKKSGVNGATYQREL